MAFIKTNKTNHLLDNNGMGNVTFSFSWNLLLYSLSGACLWLWNKKRLLSRLVWKGRGLTLFSTWVGNLLERAFCLLGKGIHVGILQLNIFLPSSHCISWCGVIFSFSFLLLLFSLKLTANFVSKWILFWTILNSQKLQEQYKELFFPQTIWW